jgi:hypothetical protein
MTLCGVLKNILLVVASVLIWGTIVNGLQIFGYGIALAGLVYYSVGYEGIQTYYTVTKTYAKKLWEGHPDSAAASRSLLIRKALLICMYATIALVLITGIAIRSGRAPQFITELTGKFSDPF